MNITQDHDANLLRRCVYCVSKAVSEDIPQFMRENHLETYNGLGHQRGNYINTNFRHHVVGQNVEMLPFRRTSWQGRIVVDRAFKNTNSVMTKSSFQSLSQIPRQKPHYIQSLLHVENGNLPAVQISLFDYTPFEDEQLEDDYGAIIQGLLDPDEGFTHYVVIYTSESDQIRDISMLLLNKRLEIVEKESLMQYITPDFALLTAPDIETNEFAATKTDEDSKTLISIKSGLKPKLRDIPEQA